jgi:hypothetical protein
MTVDISPPAPSATLLSTTLSGPRLALLWSDHFLQVLRLPRGAPRSGAGPLAALAPLLTRRLGGFAPSPLATAGPPRLVNGRINVRTLGLSSIHVHGFML